jgi:EAL domain-containing protein (putative c-di-GMP-specific phosphodiesterase class I)
MAHSLGLGLVAEGVENEAQVAFLADEGCNMLQGYYYGKPMSVKQLDEWLDKDLKATVAN